MRRNRGALFYSVRCFLLWYTFSFLRNKGKLWQSGAIHSDAFSGEIQSASCELKENNENADWLPLASLNPWYYCVYSPWGHSYIICGGMMRPVFWEIFWLVWAGNRHTAALSPVLLLTIDICSKIILKFSVVRWVYSISQKRNLQSYKAYQ